jgi:hypothetical protein
VLLVDQTVAEEDIRILLAKPVLELGWRLRRISTSANEKEGLAPLVSGVQRVKFHLIVTVERPRDWR